MPNQSTNQQTTHQKRAAHAYRLVRDVVENAGDKAKEYKSLSRGFPAMVQIDGLGAALAFLKAKAAGDKNTPHGRLYEHLEKWLTSQNHTSGDLLHSITQLDSTRYRQIAVEVQAYMVWIKRFAEAEIKGEAKG